MKKKRLWGILAVAAVWLGLTVFTWFHSPQSLSLSERRPLAQFPALTPEAVASGDFMEDFESYSLDQFPARDFFRQIKSWVHYYALGQKDNNGIYMEKGYAAKLEYPLNQTSVEHALEKFTGIYETWLKGTDSKIFFSIIPDKSYYLAREKGYPAMDYEQLFAMVEAGAPWAQQIRLTDCLSAECYYRTDTHWRQERLLPAAQRLCSGLGVTIPRAEDFRSVTLERPFYGVYYGQAMLPMTPDEMILLESDATRNSSVFHLETVKNAAVYDKTKLSSNDLYDVFLSGPGALQVIENPDARTDRELILFRDSYGSSMAPLLLQGYRKVTLVDIRYISPQVLGQFVTFQGQDVLFLYSTLVLNNSATLRG